MKLELERGHWKQVKFGDVVEQSKEKVDPSNGDVSRVVAGEHMESDNLKIRRWGAVDDGYLGPAFHRRFRPGQVLYGSRRTYLRKVAVADFDGVCSNTTFVLGSKAENQLLTEFLPWIMTSEPFHAFAIAESKGSVNPYVNFSDLAAFEFELPPIEQQQALADTLWAAQKAITASADLVRATEVVRRQHLQHRMQLIAETGTTVPLDSLVEDGRPICYGILMPGMDTEGGVPVVKVRDFPDGYIRTTGLLRTAPEIAADYKRSTLRPGDLLISIRGTVGRLAKVPEQLGGANITQDTARISVGHSHSSDYVLLALESEFVQQQIRRQTTGLAVKGLNIGALREILIPIPRNISQERELLSESKMVNEAMLETSIREESARSLMSALIGEIWSPS
jgi:type I restriction enzyme, S subunit